MELGLGLVLEVGVCVNLIVTPPRVRDTTQQSKRKRRASKAKAGARDWGWEIEPPTLMFR